MRARLRVLDDDRSPASWNMALDEALLAMAGEPTLRLYGWHPHAVSLGWFQRRTDFADLGPDVPMVRRTTGGGAIHHGDELTYALVADSALLPGCVETVYVLVHDAITAALRRLGVPAERLLDGHAPSARPSSRWCFADPGRHDVVGGDGRKLVGSAQRRTAQPTARTLLHGSIVLRAPALTPFVAAVDEHVDAAAAERALRRELPVRIGEALGFEPAAGAIRDAEAAMARTLARTQHDSGARLARR